MKGFLTALFLANLNKTKVQAARAWIFSPVSRVWEPEDAVFSLSSVLHVETLVRISHGVFKNKFWSFLSSWVSAHEDWEICMKKKVSFLPQSQRAKIVYAIFRAGQWWIRNAAKTSSPTSYRSDGVWFPLGDLVWILLGLHSWKLQLQLFLWVGIHNIFHLCSFLGV